MNKLKLRGYVTPEDFEGNDKEKIQKALELAKKEDICKVVLTGCYRPGGAIVVPCGMHLVLDHAVLYGDLINEVINNFSFEQDRIYVEGKESKIVGNVMLCHTNHAVLEGLAVDGDVSLRFSRNFRIEHAVISGELRLGRGCQNGIMQHLSCDRVIASGEIGGEDMVGRDVLIKNIVLRDAEIAGGACLLASRDCGFLNVQLDEITAQANGVLVGNKTESLPKEQYQNFTFTNIHAAEAVVFYNECLHVYVK